MARTLLLAVLSSLCSGCFSFATTMDPRPGETARVQLVLTERYGDGTEEPLEVEGVVVSSTLYSSPVPGAIRLERRTRETAGAFREFVRVDTTQILEVDLRQVQVRRVSWIKSLGGVAVLGAIAAAMRVGFDTDETGR